MMNVQKIERDAWEHGVVGTVRKNVTEGQHKAGVAYFAGKITGYAALLAFAAGIGYLLFGAVI